MIFQPIAFAVDRHQPRLQLRSKPRGLLAVGLQQRRPKRLRARNDLLGNLFERLLQEDSLVAIIRYEMLFSERNPGNEGFQSALLGDEAGVFPDLQVRAGLWAELPAAHLRATVETRYIGERRASDLNVLENNGVYTLDPYVLLDATMGTVGLEWFGDDRETVLEVIGRNLLDTDATSREKPAWTIHLASHSARTASAKSLLRINFPPLQLRSEGHDHVEYSKRCFCVGPTIRVLRRRGRPNLRRSGKLRWVCAPDVRRWTPHGTNVIKLGLVAPLTGDCLGRRHPASKRGQLSPSTRSAGRSVTSPSSWSPIDSESAILDSEAIAAKYRTAIEENNLVAGLLNWHSSVAHRADGLGR